MYCRFLQPLKIKSKKEENRCHGSNFRSSSVSGFVLLALWEKWRILEQSHEEPAQYIVLMYKYINTKIYVYMYICIFLLTGRSETDRKKSVEEYGREARENWVHPLSLKEKRNKNEKKKKRLFNDMPETSVFIIAYISGEHIRPCIYLMVL